MMHNRIYPRKLLRTVALIVLALGIALALWFSYHTLYARMVDETTVTSLERLHLVASLIEEKPGLVEASEILHIARHQQKTRLTYIDAEGRVIGDSMVADEELHNLDNHSDRLEFILAAEHGSGSVVRRSATFDADAVYTMLRMENGNYLRLAVPFSSVNRSIQREFVFLLSVSAGLLALTLLIFIFERHVFRSVLRQMSRLVRSVALGEFKGPVTSMGWDELQPLVTDINTMSATIRKTIAALTDKSHQLQTIFDSIKEGVAILDNTGAITTCNAGFLRFFPSCVVGDRPQAISCIPLPKLQQNIERIVAGGEAEQNSFRYSASKGEQLFISLYKPAVAAPEAYLVVTVQDVTKLMQLERAQVDFVANVSHELRTPLTAIKGYGEALWQSRYSEKEGRMFAGKIVHHADMLHTLVEELLSLAVLDAPGTGMDEQGISLGECAQKARQIIVESGGFTGKITVDEQEYCPVRGSRALLVQAIRNLLENACVYSPAEKTVEVTVARQGEKCFVSVADQGPGISKESQERIFERFYRYQKQRNGMHSGLGLAIASQIVERAGGTIRVESPAKNASTVFTIELPLAEIQPLDGVIDGD